MVRKEKRIFYPVISMCFFLLLLGMKSDENRLWKSLHRENAKLLSETLYDTFMPGVSYEKGKKHTTFWLWQEQVEVMFPIYGYVTKDLEEDTQETVEKDWNGQILLSQTQVLSVPSEEWEETDLQGENNPNEVRQNEIPQGDVPQNETQQSNTNPKEGQGEENAEEMIQDVMAFVPHQQMLYMDLSRLGDYETLLDTFYTVDPSTTVSGSQLNIDKFLEHDFSISKDGEGPQILIFHTHSKEAFADSEPGDRTTSIVGVGDYLTQVLTQKYGYNVLHHTESYDADSNAYSRALIGLEKVLEENPSIEVIIDLHRDEMKEGTKLVMDLDGRPTARFMFFNGLSRTKKTGDISYLYNENQEGNLAFSFQMQLMAAQFYPGLTRKIYLKGYRYNMHLKEKYLLVELGAQNNTVEEAKNACDPLAHILDLVLDN